MASWTHAGLAGLLLLAAPAAAQTADPRVEALLARMTLQEKLDQLHQEPIGTTDPHNVASRRQAFQGTFGSYLFNRGTGSAAMREELLKLAEGTRLKIPPLFGADVIHGYRTIYPIPLAEACTWDPELFERTCREAAHEAAARGVDWTFAPMVDIALDPRWGRVAETFGESPYADSRFCRAAVRGFQGPDLAAPGDIAACLKHFAAYGASEGGRDYSYADVSDQRMWELYLPPFRAGVEAGCVTVMSAFDDLNGVPASANRFLLTDVLRQRWGFHGFVVSDWNAVKQLIHQGFAADDADATARAILAGVDMDMADGLYRRQLPALIASGRVPPSAVDEAVRRVLRVKAQLGLLTPEGARARTWPAGRAETPDTGIADSARALAREFAGESIVLLKNREAALPLGAAKRIAVIGPLATDRTDLMGSWKQAGQEGDMISVLDAIRRQAGPGATVETAEGCDIDGGGQGGFGAAVAAARRADAVVLCLGETGGMTGENASRSTIRLPGSQEDLALAVARAGRPVILVIFSGRPIELERIEPAMTAIVEAWQPGTEAGPAVADVLFGIRNPSGRLAITFPLTGGQIPIYHNMHPRARAGAQGAYQDISTQPLYPFGFGLSYTRFKYGPIRLRRDGDTVHATVEVTNTGSRNGVETVFWFTHQRWGQVTRPMKELRFFERADIPAGGRREFEWDCEVRTDLAYPDGGGRSIAPEGTIDVIAGPESTSFEVGT